MTTRSVTIRATFDTLLAGDRDVEDVVTDALLKEFGTLNAYTVQAYDSTTVYGDAEDLTS